MKPHRAGLLLLFGGARSLLSPFQPCPHDTFLPPTHTAWLVAPSTTASAATASRQHQPRRRRQRPTARAATTNGLPSHGDGDNSLRRQRRKRQPLRVTTSSLSMGRRTELGASPWKTDSRTVQGWLQLSDRELGRLSKVLGPSRSGRDLEERLGLQADGKTDSIVGFLRVDFRMSKADTRAVVMRFPRLLFMPRETAVDRCHWLVDALGLNKKQMATMVLRCPTLFAYGAEASYAPIVEWLKAYLGMNTKEVARLVIRLPQVLSLRPDGKLDKTVRFMESLGLSTGEVSKLVLRHPGLFSYSVEDKIIPMLEWLQTQLRSSPDEVKVIEIVTKYPSLLGCSTTRNLAPKLSFLREILKASVEDIRTAVVACPSLLGYSLERRIRPRVALMLERGIDPNFNEHKWLLTSLPEESFEVWVRDSGRSRC